MIIQTEKTWEEEIIEQFREEGARGEARGKEKGLSALRFALRIQLEQRFQTLPEEIQRRIDSADVDSLKTALASVLSIQSLNELTL